MLSRLLLSHSTLHNFKASISLRSPLIRSYVRKFKSSGNENFIVAKEKGKIVNNFKLTLLGGTTLGILSKGIIRVKCEARVPQLAITQKHEDVKFDWKLLWSYLKDHLFKLFGAFLAGLAVACLNIYIPLVLAQFVDAVSKYASDDVQRSVKNFIKDVVLQEQSTVRLLLLYGAQSVFTFLYIYLLGNIGEKMALEMRRDLFQNILMQDVEFFDSHNSGELLNRITSDVQEFKSSFKQTLSQGLRCIAQIFGGSISLFFMSPQLATVALVSMSSAIFIGSILGHSLRELSKKSQAQTEKATNVCSEALTNIRTVKACAAEHIELMMFEKELEASKELSQRLGTGIAFIQALSNMFLNCIIMGTLYYGGHLMSTEAISSGELMSFMFATQGVQRSLQQGSILLGNFIRGLTAGSRVFELIKIKPKIDLVEGLVIEDELLKGEIRFDNVTFSYPSRPDQIILDEFSLTLKPGQTVALVGVSGSGKSTIAELLERFYEPTSGKIYLDGVEFSEISPVWLRNDIIGYIDQEPTLFGCSILDNIRYGNENATFEEIIEVSKQAQAHDFIEKLPEQYDTSVGERGGALSGGQRQRIAMARALVKKPILLILDEATSALDAKSAQELQKALKKGTVNQTKLIIAHRLNPIQYADLIVLIEDGKIKERGTHDQLMLRKGAYYDLVRQEQQRETEEDKRRFLLKKVVKEYVTK